MSLPKVAAVVFAALSTDLGERTKKLAAELAAVGVAVDVEKLTVSARKPSALVADLEEQNVALLGASWFEGLWVFCKALGLGVEASPLEFRRNYNRGAIGPQAAWYFAATKTLAFDQRQIDDSALVDGVIAHELTHAAQDQRDGLPAIFARFGATTDGWIRARMVTEGEAEVAARLVARARSKDAAPSVDERALRVTSEEERQGGMSLQYGAGRQFVGARYARGGWKEVLASFEKPPVSTEQMTHPEKLDDAPVAVTVPDWPAALGDAELVREDTHGELGLRMLLAIAGVVPSKAHPASIGWDGDRSRIWRTKEGKLALVWRSVWDDDQDAQQFEEVLTARAQGRVVRRARAVDWAWAEDAAAQDALAAALAAATPPDSGSETDSRSADAIERAWSARQPRFDGRVWTLPELAVRVPAPQGWVQEEISGQVTLMRPDVVDDFRDNFTAQRAPTELTSIEALLEEARESLPKVPGVSPLRLAGFRIANGEAMVAEYRYKLPSYDLHAIELRWIHGGERISITATVLEKHWAEFAPVLERLFPRIELLK